MRLFDLNRLFSYIQSNLFLFSLILFLLFFLFFHLVDEFGKFTFIILKQLLGRIVFTDLAKAQNKYHVAFYDSLKPMCNRDDSTLLKFFLNKRLDALLSDNIDVCCGFVKDDHLILPQNRSTNAN